MLRRLPFALALPLALSLFASTQLGCVEQATADAEAVAAAPAAMAMVAKPGDKPAAAPKLAALRTTKLAKLDYPGVKLDPKRAFALQAKGGPTFVLELRKKEARIYVVPPGGKPSLYWKAPVSRSMGKYTLKKGGNKAKLQIKGGKLLINGKASKLVSLAEDKAVPSLGSVAGNFSRLASKAQAMGPGTVGILPPYDGCCADCCAVHERLGLPDWCDAWCCQGTCGGSGSCTPSDDGGEGVDPDPDSDELTTQTPSGF